ncbi:hypothetical protein H5410_052610 [Solanum commersonii]|uniref:Uncharacterized protein n=1 Tax=Solanum commersonii TaxID=4109 RepID=A0A9J5X2N5_SOLCO|nr:hypothetical protein H5410_052610 [Solanum commersonii]
MGSTFGDPLEIFGQSLEKIPKIRIEDGREGPPWQVRSNRGWNLSFRRPFNDREILRLVEFYRNWSNSKELQPTKIDWSGKAHQGSFRKGRDQNPPFIHRRITLQLWEMFLSKKDPEPVMPRKIDQTLKILSNYANPSHHKDRWKIIPLASGGLFGRKKPRCHQNKSNKIQKMKMKCLVLFHFWCKQEYREDLESSMDVLRSL